MVECSAQSIEGMNLKELKKRRMQLLEEIHKQQELLDQIDYVIFKKEKIGGKAD